MGMTPIKIKWHLGAIIKKIGYKICFGSRFKMGRGSTFRSDFHVYLEKGGKIHVGKNVFFNNNCSLNCFEKITIGDNCLFGEGVKIYDHNHMYRDFDTPIGEQGFTHKPVSIGANTWVGSNVVILQGVTIGEHCVIGANCLIYKDVPPHTVVMQESKRIERPIAPAGEE